MIAGVIPATSTEPAYVVGNSIGAAITEFPGNHAITTNSPQEFERKLCEVLEN